MLLATFSTLFLLGLSIWLVGHYFRYTGVAAIGAAFVIIAGSAIALTGLETRVGETRVVSNNTTAISYETEPVLAGLLNPTVLRELGLGGLVMALGAVLLGQTIAEEI